VRDYLLAHYPEVDPARLVVIPRGIDPEAFPRGFVADDDWRQRFLADHPQLEGGPLLTLPGRGTRLKGHADAIRLLARLRGAAMDARLLLLGAREVGRERYVDELLALARQLGVADAVAVTEPRRDVREVYSISALVLQLSTRPEAFGRTVLEALSLGRPVVGYAHGGVGEQLATHFPDGAVAPDAADALFERAQTLLRSPVAISPVTAPTRADMQAATLAVYASLLASPA
jgi:glycosyltransferase involved in cell wall biosynthesis